MKKVAHVSFNKENNKLLAYRPPMRSKSSLLSPVRRSLGAGAGFGGSFFEVDQYKNKQQIVLTSKLNQMKRNKEKKIAQFASSILPSC
jgi:hypothetical protein